MRAALHIDASALVALIGQITDLAQRDGSDRAWMLAEAQALAENPGDFFEVKVDGMAIDSITVRAVPSPRMVRLLTTFGGVK